MANDAQWYVVTSGGQQGPYSTAQILQAVRGGALRADTPICQHGAASFQPVAQTEPFAAEFRSAGASPPRPDPQAGRSSAEPEGKLSSRLGPRIRTVAGITAGVLVVSLLSAMTWRIYRGSTHDPSEIASEMMPVLLDLSAARRARSCEEHLANLAEFQAGKPYTVVEAAGEYCKGVSKSKTDKVLFGGFYLSQLEKCETFKQKLPEDTARFENNLEVKVKLYCDANRKPSLDVENSAVQLAAQIQLGSSLPTVVEHVNEGKVSPQIKRCYVEVKKQVTDAQTASRKLRCKVMTSDMAVEKITYDAIWSNAKLMDEFDRYKEEHKLTWEAMRKADKETVFFDAFTNEQRTKACAEEASPSLEAQAAAGTLASATCM